MKRSKAPSWYPIHRKEYKWIIKPSPGPHPISESLPLTIILREVLSYASNVREVKYILNRGYVKVDGRIIKDHRFPVGLMDILELVPEKKFFRMLPKPDVGIYPFEISVDESIIKPCKVKVKKKVKGGVIQFTFHDGRSILEKDVDKACKVKPGDTLLLNINEGGIIDHIPLERGILAIITHGKKLGFTGRIVEILQPSKLREKVVQLKLRDDVVIQTVKSYVFPIGREKPVISLVGG